MKDKSSLGILGILLLILLVFILIKYTWYVLIIGGILVLLFIILLIRSSKKTKGSASSLDEQVRTALSKIRQQKFKAEAKITRLEQWANDAIATTYENLFGDKFFRNELVKNYVEIKETFATEIPEAQVEKTDLIVDGYVKHIETERAKIEALDKLQQEHEELREKLKNATKIQRTGQKLDKHVNRLQNTSDDLSGEETIIKADYTLDDLKTEVELNTEYVKQLEELTLKYGDNIGAPEVDDYKNQLNELKAKL